MSDQPDESSPWYYYRLPGVPNVLISRLGGKDSIPLWAYDRVPRLDGFRESEIGGDNILTGRFGFDSEAHASLAATVLNNREEEGRAEPVLREGEQRFGISREKIPSTAKKQMARISPNERIWGDVEQGFFEVGGGQIVVGHRGAWPDDDKATAKNMGWKWNPRLQGYQGPGGGKAALEDAINFDFGSDPRPPFQKAAKKPPKPANQRRRAPRQTQDVGGLEITAKKGQQFGHMTIAEIRRYVHDAGGGLKIAQDAASYLSKSGYPAAVRSVVAFVRDGMNQTSKFGAVHEKSDKLKTKVIKIQHAIGAVNSTIECEKWHYQSEYPHDVDYTTEGQRPDYYKPELGHHETYNGKGGVKQRKYPYGKGAPVKRPRNAAAAKAAPAKKVAKRGAKRPNPDGSD